MYRRAYLDTYAKKRAHQGVVHQAAQAPVTAQPPNPVPQHALKPQVQPSVVVVPVQAKATARPSDTAQTIPDQLAALATQIPSKAAPAKAKKSARAYVGQLLKRKQSVGATYAPNHEMTEQAPVAARIAHHEYADVHYSSDLEPEKPVDSVPEIHIEANLEALYGGSLTKQITENRTSASASHVRTIVASALTCGVLAVGMFTFLSRVDSQPVVAQPIGSPVIEVEAPASQPQANGTPVTAPSGEIVPADPSHPVRLVMSSIGVNAPVEGLGTTSDGLIAVPKSYGVVGWYNKGSVPGKPGPAVLVGHYASGQGAVFDKLTGLKDGDLITTTNGRGESFTYRVIKKAEYERDKVPMQDIFKKSDASRLEIITCAGKWQANNYDKRLVVTAELVQ